MTAHVDPAADRTTVLEPVALRRVNTIAEYRQCEQLQERIWGPDGVARVPLLDLVTAQENGGLVLGAFDRTDLAGFVYSFLGMDPRRGLKHCSVVLGVAPEHRGRGIGVRLKLGQREEVLRQGIDLITWTYDPLLAVNANLNICRLGASSREYRVNHYDSGRGPAAGLDTDRLIVDWRLRAAPVDARRRSARAVPTAHVEPRGELPRVAAVDFDVDALVLLLPIPADLPTILRVDLGLARHWREHTRTLFQAYFARGYAVTGFELGCGPGIAGYRLSREADR